MGRDILIRSIGKLIFHNKVQQSSINITSLRTSGGRSKRSANKINVVGILEITQLGVLLSHRDHANEIALKNRPDEKTANEKEGE